METISIEKTKAQAAWQTATAKERALLEKLLGTEPFTGKITDRIKTFEDACKALGIKSKEVISITGNDKALNNDLASINAYAKLIIITRALNDGWQPDWKDSNQYKYYPWFKMGSGLSYDVYVLTCTDTCVGSRLCLKSAELAKYIGTQFSALYSDYFIQ